jgi:hypothetical protein
VDSYVALWDWGNVGKGGMGTGSFFYTTWPIKSGAQGSLNPTDLVLIHTLRYGQDKTQLMNRAVGLLYMPAPDNILWAATVSSLSSLSHPPLLKTELSSSFFFIVFLPFFLFFSFFLFFFFLLSSSQYDSKLRSYNLFVSQDDGITLTDTYFPEHLVERVTTTNHSPTSTLGS